MKRIVEFFIGRQIKQHFGFLFDKGFKIRHIHYSPDVFGNWGVVLESPDCFIKIVSDREAILLSFAPLEDLKNGLGIEPIIFFLSNGQNFVGSFKGNLFWDKKHQYERLAKLLEEYYDQIKPYFGVDFEKHKKDLMVAGNEYIKIALRTYSRNPRII